MLAGTIGAWPHVCINNYFAMMEAQLVLATLGQRVTFELVPGQTIEPEPLITLRPKGGIQVVMRRREAIVGWSWGAQQGLDPVLDPRLGWIVLPEEGL